MQNILSSHYEQVNQMNQSAVDTALRLSEVSARAVERLARQQLAAVEACMQAGVKQWRAVGEAKGPQDLVSRQAEVAAELGEQLITMAQEDIDIQVQAREELSRTVEDCMEDGIKALKVMPAT